MIVIKPKKPMTSEEIAKARMQLRDMIGFVFMMFPDFEIRLEPPQRRELLSSYLAQLGDA